MDSSLTFLGEINIYKNIRPDATFGDFGSLPNINMVRQLAAEFGDHLELMAYQESGDSMMLAVSIYLRPNSNDGRIIAILVRDPYPEDLGGVLNFVQLAQKRLDLLSGLYDRFSEQSIISARRTLEQLERRLVVELGQKIG